MPSIPGLETIHENPDLLEYIQTKEWEGLFDSQSLQRARAYTKSGRLLSLKVLAHLEDEDNNTIVIESSFRGNSQKNYTTHVFLEYDDISRGKLPRWEAFSECTCPVQIACKHGAAALIALNTALARPSITRMTTAKELEIFEWLKELKQSPSAPSSATASQANKNPPTQFLAYCLYPRPDDYDTTPRILLHLGREMKSGQFINTSSSPTADISKEPKYMRPEDAYPTYLIRKGTYGYYDGRGTPVTGSLGGQILKETLKTGRLFLSYERYNKKQPAINILLGDPVTPRLEWAAHTNGSATPEVNFSCRGMLLPTNPAYLLSTDNTEAPTLHLIDTSEHSPETIRHWQNGPTIPARHLSTITPQLVKTQLPTPKKFQHHKLPKTTPIPHLKLHRKNPFTHGGLHLSGQPEPIIAEISFDYAGHSFSPDLGTLPTEKASFTIVTDDSMIEIERDILSEEKYIEQLMEEHQMTPAYEHDPDVHPKHLSSMLPNAGPSDWDIVWTAFTTFSILDLQKDGWQIDQDTSAEFEVWDIGEDQLDTGLEEMPDHGIDWFQFQSSYLTPEGEKCSLLPLLSELLQRLNPDELIHRIENTPDTEKSLFKDPETGNLLTLPVARILALVKNIHDLFGMESPDQPLHKIQAANIADELKLDSSKTLRALAELGNNLKNITSLPKPKVPKSVNAELRDYQLDGFHWLQFLARHSLHGILADDMGLGKTLQTLTHIQAEVSSRRNKKSPALVIAPTSVVGNWEIEAEKFCPNLKVLFLHGLDRKSKFDQIDSHHLVLTTYGLLVRDFEILKEHTFHIVALDEAQYIKNPASKASQMACQLNARHRVSLSGTPIENHLGELWSQMRFLMPGLLGSQEAFRKHFRTPIEKRHDTQAQAALNRRVAPLILRRTKDQVATELPEKTHILHTIPLNKQQIDIYETVRASMDKRIRDAISAQGLGKSQIIVLDALLKLRQICCHPQLLKLPAAQKIKHSAKLDFLTQDLLPTLLEEGRKILLFSSFTSMLKLIEDHLIKEDIPYAKITGQTQKRQRQIDHFQNGDARIFIISLKAGGTGLNLTAADTVIHYDPWWNPAAENQATDRAHRIGQTKPVFVHKLICEGSIEQRIQELQAQKSALVDALLTAETTKLKMDKETLNNLLTPID